VLAELVVVEWKRSSVVGCSFFLLELFTLFARQKEGERQ